MVKLPHTGNETVLDAVANVGGLSSVSSKKLWVARPAPTDCGNVQILPVDWCGITMRGEVKTNFQLLPGDRIFIMGQPLTTFDTMYARTLAPIQRTLGLTIFGASAYQTAAGGLSARLRQQRHHADHPAREVTGTAIAKLILHPATRPGGFIFGGHHA